MHEWEEYASEELQRAIRAAWVDGLLSIIGARLPALGWLDAMRALVKESTDRFDDLASEAYLALATFLLLSDETPSTWSTSVVEIMEDAAFTETIGPGSDPCCMAWLRVLRFHGIPWDHRPDEFYARRNVCQWLARKSLTQSLQYAVRDGAHWDGRACAKTLVAALSHIEFLNLMGWEMGCVVFAVEELKAMNDIERKVACHVLEEYQEQAKGAACACGGALLLAETPRELSAALFCVERLLPGTPVPDRLVYAARARESDLSAVACAAKEDMAYSLAGRCWPSVCENRKKRKPECAP